MKLKKFNVFLAVGTLAGTAMLYGLGGFVLAHLPWADAQQVVRLEASGAHSQIVFGSKTAFSSEGKQVVTIPWASQKGQLPAGAVLEKWSDGGRTYYRLSGPINPQYADIAAGKRQDWGSFFSCEVFFQRGGGAYDQWAINPNGSMVYEYSSASTQNACGSTFSGQNNLPESRYHGSITGDRVELTFWCDSQDEPANIVFNYNDPKTGSLNWVTTGSHKSGSGWNHHWAGDWNYP